MAQEKSADQTEKPTAKRLRDARKEGQVHRSQDLSRTVLIAIWLLMFWFLGRYLYNRIDAAMQAMFRDIPHATPEVLVDALFRGSALFLQALAPFLVVAALTAAMVEFLQVGGLFAIKRITPQLQRLDPMQGLKRIFSQESLVEVVKSVVKTLALVGIVTWVTLLTLDQYLTFPYGRAADVLKVHSQAVLWVAIWVVFVFLFISVLDAFYQRYAFIKNLKMSRRDVRQERKDTEGDQEMKGKRKELHQEWSEQNMLAAVRSANVVVTNPTHVAVALHYDPDETDLPVVVAKGEDHQARLIRAEAEQAGVPVMQDIELARGLHESIEVDGYIAPEFFQAVAELLRWAEGVREP